MKKKNETKGFCAFENQALTMPAIAIVLGGNDTTGGSSGGGGSTTNGEGDGGQGGGGYPATNWIGFFKPPQKMRWQYQFK